MRRNIYLLFVLTVIGFRALAQHENTLYTINNIPQVTYLNPAIMPNYKVSLGLPLISSTYFAFANTGFSYNDIIKAEGSSKKYLDLNSFYAGLKPKNHTKVMLNSDLFSLGFRAGFRTHISFNVTEKINTRLMLPKGLFWAVEGNAPEVAGGSIQMAPKLDFMHYREYGVGTSYMVNSKLNVGVRAKFLYGKSNINTAKSDWSLNTSPEAYQLSLRGNTLLNTSGIDRLVNGDDFEALDYAMNKNNKGLAFDLGGTYKLLDRLTISASVLDFGSIKWTDDVKNYELKNGAYSFEGFTLTNGDGLENIGDSISKAFKFNETSKAYKTPLPTKFYLGGNYLLFRNCYANVLLFGELYQQNFAPSFSASLTKDFGRVLSLSVSYTGANRSYRQIGSGFILKLKNMQWYMVSDNVIGAALMPKSTKDINARLGINYVFGRIPTQDKQSYK